MMDLSDGLSTDLTRLCQVSGVGARIWADRLPMADVPRALRRGGLRFPEPLHLALHGGEDYQLLFTVPKRLAGRIRDRWHGVKITEIGEIVRGRGIELYTQDGKSTWSRRRGGTTLPCASEALLEFAPKIDCFRPGPRTRGRRNSQGTLVARRGGPAGRQARNGRKRDTSTNC